MSFSHLTPTRIPAFAAFLLSFFTLLTGHAQTISTDISSVHLLTGEQAALTISFQNASLKQPPKLKTSEGLEVTFNKRQSGQAVFGPSVTRYIYNVSAPLAGSYEIEGLSFALGNGQSLTTQSIQLTVREPTTPEIIWATARVGSTTLEYGTAVYIDSLTPYVGQVQPVELKVYLPRTLRFRANSLPDMEVTGLNAHRFEPSDQISEVRLKGQLFRAITYRTVVSALSSGRAQLGPGTVQIPAMTEFPRRQFVLEPEFSQLALDAKALPAGAPESFAGAVGQFEFEAQTDLESAEPGGPFSVRLEIGGSGNLDIIDAPELTDSQNWKLYPSTRSESENIRHEGRGLVTFEQLVRPTKEVDAIPPFEFSFFNPVDERYVTLTTESFSLPEALRKLPATGSANPTGAILPPAKVDQPIEEMLDTLGIINPLRSKGAPVWPPSGTSSWLWICLFPLSLIALVLTPAARQMLAKQRSKVSLLPAQSAALQDLRDFQGNRQDFYRASGKLIEQNPRLSTHPETLGIVEKRDDLCFSKQALGTESIPDEEKNKVVETIKAAFLNSRVLSVVLTLALTLSSSADKFEETEEAFLNGNFEEVLATYQDQPPTADVLYNIGTAYSRLEEPGKAALYFRRALALEPDHPEARQNLRFVERANGSLTPPDPGWSAALTHLPHGMYRSLTWFSALFAVLFFILLWKQERRRSLFLALAVLSCFGAALSFFFNTAYPEYGDFRAATNQGVITGDGQIARNQPAESGTLVIKTPPGSLCKVVARRGNWTYVSLPGEVRGWVPSEAVEEVLSKEL